MRAFVPIAASLLGLSAAITLKPHVSADFSASMVDAACPNGPIIAESIPLGIPFVPDVSTRDAWLELFAKANDTIDIAAFYFSLTDGVHQPGGSYGIDIYNGIVAAAKRGVYIRVVANVASDMYPQTDLFSLMAAGAVDGRFMNFSEVYPPASGGVLHTKFILADQNTFYVGSANMDWRSLAHVKELGLYFADCPAAAVDIDKIFQVYWSVASTGKLPNPWPTSVIPLYNLSNPASFVMNGSDSNLFFSMAPPFIRPPQWTPDEDAITHAITNAKSIVRFEVMDYMPGIMYANPIEYWDVIDGAIRALQFNTSVTIQILIGYWQYSFPQQWYYLKSLNDLPNVEVRYFIVPPITPPIPFTRVNHAKWMITDSAFYVTTSNWVGDYFTNTAGVGVTIWNNPEIMARAAAVFERDWTSAYSIPLPLTPTPSPSPSPAALSRPLVEMM